MLPLFTTSDKYVFPFPLIHSAHLGDFDPELHEPSTDYITEFKFIPNQVKVNL